MVRGKGAHAKRLGVARTGMDTRSSGPSFSLGASMMKRRLAACRLILTLGCVSSSTRYSSMHSWSLPVACRQSFTLDHTTYDGYVAQSPHQYCLCNVSMHQKWVH